MIKGAGLKAQGDHQKRESEMDYAVLRFYPSLAFHFQSFALRLEPCAVRHEISSIFQFWILDLGFNRKAHGA